MNEASTCARRNKCAFNYCDNPEYGFVSDTEEVRRLLFSPKMFDIHDNAVLYSAFSVDYMASGMSVDRSALVQDDLYPAHLSRLATMRSKRSPDDRAQAIVVATASAIREVSKIFRFFDV